MRNYEERHSFFPCGRQRWKLCTLYAIVSALLFLLALSLASAHAQAILSKRYGVAGDIPVPGDNNGDGLTDLAVFRPASGQWFVDTNRDGVTNFSRLYGARGDIPVPGDYDGDGITDLAVFRPAVGRWFIDTNRDGITNINRQFGINGDILVPGDYVGDFITDMAVWRPSNGTWYASGPLPGENLDMLLGTWRFDYILSSSPFSQTYTLQRVETVNGVRVIVGADSFGDPIIAARTRDLTSEPFPYAYALLDPGSIICRFFVFNQVAPDRLEGEHIQLSVTSTGDCGSPTTSTTFPLVGTRLSGQGAAQIQTDQQDEMAERQAALQDNDIHSQREESIPDPFLVEGLESLLEALQ